MLFKLSGLLNSPALTSFENLLGRYLQRNIHATPVQLGQTQWSRTRPRNTGRRMELPRRLTDGKFYRNQSKGGRNAEGHTEIRHIGGGRQRNWRLVEKVRVPLLAADEEPVVIRDRILQIGYDPFRSGDLALVAGNSSMKTRLILAPHLMKVGDIITASRGPPQSASRMIPGDAYPLEYLPFGTMVHNIERVPGGGGVHCCSGGTHAVLVRKTETHAILKNSSKIIPQLVIDLKCLAVVGQVSNPNHHLLPIGKAGRNRWLNKRPKGLTGKDRWHHKKKGGSQMTKPAKKK